jgi:hypothetical protein
LRQILARGDVIEAHDVLSTDDGTETVKTEGGDGRPSIPRPDERYCASL